MAMDNVLLTVLVFCSVFINISLERSMPGPTLPPGAPKQYTRCEEACKDKPLDIAFVIDGSASIWPANFTLGLWFVQDFLDIFQIGQDSVRAAVVTFGDKVYRQDGFGFQRYTDKDILKTAVKNIPYRSGLSTETGAGLRYMRETYLPQARPGVRTVVIVLTDGNSQRGDVTERQARITREMGLDVYAIGVGHEVEEAELRRIAGEDDHVFEVTSYDLLATLRSRLAFDICEVWPVNPDAVCRDNPIDISLVIDASSSIGETNFTIGLNFIKSFVESFDISPRRARVSAVTYGRGVYENTAFDFDAYPDEVSVVDALSNIPYTAGNYTDTGRAIEYMRDRQMIPKQRPTAAHVAVVLTDGKSQNWQKTYAEAAESQKAGIIMFAIGVGLQPADEELLKIAGNPDNVFTVDDYRALEGIKRKLDVNICKLVLEQFHAGLAQG